MILQVTYLKFKNMKWTQIEGNKCIFFLKKETLISLPS